MESANNTQRTLQYVQSQKKNGRVYVQGLISLGVFAISAIIAVLVYIPYISETAEIAKRRELVDSDVTALQKKYDTISSYSIADLANQLQDAKHYIPDDIRVAQLATFINSNAKEYSLAVSRIGINEDKTEIKPVDSSVQAKLLGSNKVENKIFLGRVEGPFSFRGTRDDIYKFLDFLVIGGYATNFDQVTIIASERDDEWSVSFFASYYYLQPLVNVEPGRALQPIQTDALKPISVVPTAEVVPSFTPTPTDTTPVTSTPTPTVSGQ
jgi:hypothetical protein